MINLSNVTVYVCIMYICKMYIHRKEKPFKTGTINLYITHICIIS